MLKAMILGLGASLFFAVTFVLNRQMNLAGGSWVWSAALRFAFMLPMLAGLCAIRGELRSLLAGIRKRPAPWLVWSSVGFGVFYASICYASTQGPSWLIAATWQVTILAGSLLTPLFFDTIATENGTRKRRRQLPLRSLAISTIILAGIVVVQFREASEVSASSAMIGSAFVLLAAFAYPLGNRNMMEVCGGNFSTIQRVCGMTLCSMPFWLILAVCGLGGLFGPEAASLPEAGQIFQTLIVAISSGVVATLLFFKATDLVRGDVHALAVVESTQAGEVFFAALGGVLAFEDRAPDPAAFAGLGLVLAGIILNGAVAR
jgi:drug/metabolite transporter (DMT)-like permease